jgi:hypothetical protein
MYSPGSSPYGHIDQGGGIMIPGADDVEARLASATA